MKITIISFALTACLFVIMVSVLSAGDKTGGEKSIFDFTMKGIDGDPVPLKSFEGKVIMIVNVASKCGLTPQYEGLQTLYSRFRDKGFVILGFPANNFLGQEPGSDEKIKEFCSLNFGVSFPMFSKISVKGKDQHPLYKYLTSKQTNPEFPGKISWNFEKFIFNRKGIPAGRFHPRVKPLDEKIIQLIEQELKEL